MVRGFLLLIDLLLYLSLPLHNSFSSSSIYSKSIKRDAEQKIEPHVTNTPVWPIWLAVLTYENSHRSGLYPNEPRAANLWRVRKLSHPNYCGKVTALLALWDRPARQ